MSKKHYARTFRVPVTFLTILNVTISTQPQNSNNTINLSLRKGYSFGYSSVTCVAKFYLLIKMHFTGRALSPPVGKLKASPSY